MTQTGGPADDAGDRPAQLDVFIIAGEASGDALGGALMSALEEAAPDPIRYRGIGGPAMQDAGLVSQFDYSELSVMGLVEILPHARRLLRRIRETVAAIEGDPPDILISIDSPGFVFSVVKRLRGRSFPRIHYVAPSVWAWRPKRVLKFRKHFDHLLALLPFEPPYFEAVGLGCTFVGHPVTEAPHIDDVQRQRFRETNGIADDAPVLCVLPGSRRGELDRHIGPFAQTIALLAAKAPGLRVTLPTLPHLQERLIELTRDWAAPVVVVSEAGERKLAMAASDVALAASGTVTLELAQARVPTVVAYRVASATAWLLRRLVRVSYVSIVNLIAGREAIREFLQQDMRPADMTAEIEALLSDETRRAAMRSAQDEAMQALGEGGPPPSRRAAEAVLDVLRDWRKTL